MARLDAIAAGGKERLAFLDTVAWSEIGPTLLKATDDGYNVLVGATPGKPLTFNSYSVHPHMLNQQLHSTAAGRYQFIYSTWSDMATRLYLRDFSPFNQDRAALCLARGKGALEQLDDGEIENALILCAPIWASLPTAGYGQHEQKMSDLVAVYNQALEKYARAVV